MLKKVVFVIVLWLIGMTFVSASPLKSLSFIDAPLPQVLKILSEKAGYNLVLSHEISSDKKITVDLKEIDPALAIEYILRSHGLTYQLDGNLLLVSTMGSGALVSVFKESSEVLELKFLQADKLKEVLTNLFPKAQIVLGGASNQLILHGRPDQIQEIKDLIKSMDKAAPQILIESQVVEISESGLTNLGVNWDVVQNGIRFSAKPNSSDSLLTKDYLATIKMLATEGKANVLANPRITTLDGNTAQINIGSRIPYAVPVSSGSTTVRWAIEYIDAGVSLKITPQIGAQGSITTAIEPEVSAISEWRTTAAGEFPVISTRNAAATIRVQDGETIAIGGLINEQERENISKLPILGDLPLLGFAFQSRTIEKTKTDIVFLITPHII
jgi:type II secretory pathway component GspD/PulD (secretin)